MPYTNNKGADQPVLPCSLISAFVVRYLHSIIPLLATAEISRLGSLCSWGSRFQSQLVANREDRFSRGVARIVLTHATRNKNWSSLCEKGTSMQSQLSPRCSLTQYMSHHTTKPTKWPVCSAKTDQPGHPPSLIRVFTVGMKNPWVLSYPWSAHQSL